MLFGPGRGRRAICLPVLLMAGCATSTPPAPVAKRAAPAQTKIVTVKQTCVTTTKPANSCAQPKPCSMIETCAEAYYRFTVCKDRSLDDGPLGERAANKTDQSNGIPCERKCGRDAVTMADRIRAQPFSPPMHAETTCGSAS